MLLESLYRVPINPAEWISRRNFRQIPGDFHGQGTIAQLTTGEYLFRLQSYIKREVGTCNIIMNLFTPIPGT